MTRDLSTLLDPVVKCGNPPTLLRALGNQDLTRILPIDTPYQSVVAPSVFTGRCSRSLTSKELKRVFEVPEAVARLMTAVTDPPSMFTTAPASVLLHLGRQFSSTPASLSITRGSPTLALEPLVINDQLWEITARQDEKAARADDAPIPVHLWDDSFWNTTPFDPSKLAQFTQRYNTARFKKKYNCEIVCPLYVLHHLAHRMWVKHVYEDLVRYAREQHWASWLEQLQGTVFLETAVDAMN